MDFNHIFSLFDDQQNYDETSLLIDFSEHPLFWVSGFNKLLSNHLFFKKYTVKTFKHISPDINVEELEKAGEELMFRKAWDYIKNIDLNKALHIDCIKLKSNEEFIEHLKLTINFYESLEEYEKCAHLKSIQNKVEEFLP
jgi:hypothetical protein